MSAYHGISFTQGQAIAADWGKEYHRRAPFQDQRPLFPLTTLAAHVVHAVVVVFCVNRAFMDSHGTHPSMDNVLCAGAVVLSTQAGQMLQITIEVRPSSPWIAKELTSLDYGVPHRFLR